MQTRTRVAGIVFLLALATAAGALGEAAPDFIPIAAARQRALGTAVTVEGRVTVRSGVFRSSADEGFAIQDQTGGIWVGLATNLRLRVGQRVRVTGILGRSEEKLQIVTTRAGVQRLRGQRLRVATGQVGPATLGFLIAVEGTVTQPVENDLPYGYKVFIDDGSGAVQIYLSASTNIRPNAPALTPGRKIRVTGFGSQYGAVYEVDPRSRQDIQRLR